MKLKLTTILILFLFIASPSDGQEVSPKVKQEIRAQMSNLRKAHLDSNTQLAETIYHDQLRLVSQSGKIYNKKEAVANLKNKFESYENLEISFLKISNKAVFTNHINERKYVQFPKGKFQLTTVWKKMKGNWMIISLQSSRIKE